MRIKMENERKFAGKKGSEEYYRELCNYIGTDLWSDMRKVVEAGYEQAVKKKDHAMLRAVFYQESKVELLPIRHGGYDHCALLPGVLNLLASDGFDNIYRAFPEGLPLAANGYSMYVKATNLILCMLYNREGKEVYDQTKVIEQAEKYVATKQPVWNRAVTACVLSILKQDVSCFSENLQKVCEGYAKTDIVKYKKLQCKCAYGLLVLAKHFLTEEEFLKVVYPEHKNFDKGYIDWLLKLEGLTDELYAEYEGDLKDINEILKMPIAITRIHQPYLGTDNPYLSAKEKNYWYLDTDKMQEEFCRDMAESSKNNRA